MDPPLLSYAEPTTAKRPRKLLGVLIGIVLGMAIGLVFIIVAIAVIDFLRHPSRPVSLPHVIRGIS